MVDLSKVLDQLSKVGYKSRIWQRAEVKELCNVLHEDEEILQATNGYYEGGFSLLVATDQRLLLVDRKPMFLTLDSIAYSMIQEVSYNYRLLNSTIHIFTTNKCLDFSSWNHSQIRAILTHSQKAMQQKGSLVLATAPTVDESKKEETQEQKQLATDQNQEPTYQVEPEAHVATMNMDEIPTMPSPVPHFSNDNTQSAYVTSNTATVGSLAVDPKDLLIGSKINPYRNTAFTQRRYDRRFY